MDGLKCELVTSWSSCKAAWAKELSKLFNIGSLTLHVIHGAFKTGFKSAEWGTENLMKALYNLFHNLPARRPDYVTVTEYENFSHAFCSTR